MIINQVSLQWLFLNIYFNFLFLNLLFYNWVNTVGK